MRFQCVSAAIAALLVLATAGPLAAPAQPRVSLVAAPALALPGSVDSNSPAVWALENGVRTLFVFTSHSGVPSLSTGPSIDRMSPAVPITIAPHPGYGVWMEAVVADDAGTWYGFYHNEWPATRCGPTTGCTTSR